MANVSRIQCAGCRTALHGVIDTDHEPRLPCPSCGATARVFNEQIAERATARDVMRFKNKRPGHKKPVWEVKVGADFHRKSARWSYVEQHIDRVANEYVKIVVDEESGEILRSVREALSEHQGYGDAKPKS